jgi:hypothetical protein
VAGLRCEDFVCRRRRTAIDPPRQESYLLAIDKKTGEVIWDSSSRRLEAERHSHDHMIEGRQISW